MTSGEERVGPLLLSKSELLALTKSHFQSKNNLKCSFSKRWQLSFSYQPLRSTSASTSMESTKLIHTEGSASRENHWAIFSPRPTQARLM